MLSESESADSGDGGDVMADTATPLGDGGDVLADTASPLGGTRRML